MGGLSPHLPGRYIVMELCALGSLWSALLAGSFHTLVETAPRAAAAYDPLNSRGSSGTAPKPGPSGASSGALLAGRSAWGAVLGGLSKRRRASALTCTEAAGPLGRSYQEEQQGRQTAPSALRQGQKQGQRQQQGQRSGAGSAVADRPSPAVPPNGTANEQARLKRVPL
jgi:hypothetical protein